MRKWFWTLWNEPAFWLVMVMIIAASKMCGARAHADDPPVTRSDVDRIVRALEANARATQELARATERAGERCR